MTRAAASRSGGRGSTPPCRHADGRGGSEALLRAAERRYAPLPELSKRIDASPAPIGAIAAFAHDVARAAAAGDAHAHAIFEEAAHELASTACAALGRLFEPGEPAIVSYAGNVFRAGALVVEPFIRSVSERRPGTQVVPPDGRRARRRGSAGRAGAGAPAGAGNPLDGAMSGPLAAIRGGLVVSCQAPAGSPLARTEHIVALARAAELGGARGIRAEGVDDVAAVSAAVELPVIGLRKRAVPGSEVYITPELGDARAVAAAGADVVAVDATRRPRPGGLESERFLSRLAGELAQPLLADVDCLEAGLAARAAGAAAVATTLSGYTGGPVPEGPDLELVARLAAELDCPVLAEGRYATPEDVHDAFDAGAFAVVVGAAITDPVALTRRFASACREGARVTR